MADEIPGQFELDLGLEADEAEAHAESEQAQFLLAQLRAANSERVKELMELGRRPDPVGVLMARVNLLLDMALDADTRIQFETAFEQTMTGMLNDWVTQARQMTLLAPPEQPLPPNGKPPIGGGLFIPG